MERAISIILFLCLLSVCLFGLMYMIICVSIWLSRRKGWIHLNRTMANHQKGKPTIPPKESDWDDINIPMR